MSGDGGCVSCWDNDRDNSKDIPWVEKYRPTTMNAILGQKMAGAFFKNMVRENDTLNLLLYGPPGTGKTSQIIMLCKGLYNADEYPQYVLEINASYDSGIDVVRDKIKSFCKRSVQSSACENGSAHGDSTRDDNGAQKKTNCYKFIILDEADTLSVEAQNALRRCIEMYSYNTRFCFICNYVTNIIAPIISRCFVCHYKALSNDVVIERLRYIAEKEGFPTIDNDVLELIATNCAGDLRRCITTLHGLYMMHNQPTTESVHDYFNMPPVDLIERCVYAKSHEQVLAISQHISSRAFAINDLIEIIVQWLLQNDTRYDLTKAHMRLSRIQYQATRATDARLLILDLLDTLRSV